MSILSRKEPGEQNARRRILPVWKFLLFVLGFLSLYGPARGSSKELEPFEVADILEPILLHAHEIPGLVQMERKKLGMANFRQGSFHAIPFQVDAVDHTGQIILDGKEPERISAGDQILWMASDMGERAPAKVLQNSGRENLIEIEMRREGEPATKWVYLWRADPRSSSSPKDYISFDLNEDLVTSPYYSLGTRSLIILNRLMWRQGEEQSTSLITQVAARFQARALFGLIPFEVREDDLINEMVGYKDGPIRVIQRVRSALNFPVGMKGPSNIKEAYYYRNSHHSQVKINLPRGGKLLLTHAVFKVFLDFARRKETLYLEFPTSEVFEVKPMLPFKPIPLLPTAPQWIDISAPEIPVRFAIYIDLPEKEAEVFHPEELIYTPLAPDTDSTSMGSLSCTIKFVPKKGDHDFTLSLYVLPIGTDQVTPANFASGIQTVLKKPYRLQQLSYSG